MFIFNKKITYTCLKWIMLNIVPSYFYQFIPKILPNKTLFLKKDLQLSSHLLCKIFFSKMELIYLACLLMVILLFKKTLYITIYYLINYPFWAFLLIFFLFNIFTIKGELRQ